MKLLTNPSLIGLWRDVLAEAQTRCDTDLKDDIEAYLIFLLIRYTNKPEIAKQIMASEFLQSVALTSSLREHALQGVGDACLLYSGLFPKVTEKRLVKISYYVTLGQIAYLTISKQ